VNEKTALYCTTALPYRPIRHLRKTNLQPHIGRQYGPSILERIKVVQTITEWISLYREIKALKFDEKSSSYRKWMTAMDAAAKKFDIPKLPVFTKKAYHYLVKADDTSTCGDNVFSTGSPVTPTTEGAQDADQHQR
jgi:hypothetical protein